MRHSQHEIDRLFREKLQQEQDNHTFDKENDWSKLALSLSATGLVRTGVMSLGAKIFSYTAKTLLIGAIALVPTLTQSVVSYNSEIAKNTVKPNFNGDLAQNNQKKSNENNAQNDVKKNIFDAFLGKDLSENNTTNSVNSLKKPFKSDLKDDLKQDFKENQTEISPENQQQSSLLALKNSTKNNLETNSEIKENSIQNLENKLVTSKENEEKELFVKTQTTAEKSQIIANNLGIEDKSSENQLVANKKVNKELFVKTQTTAEITAKDKKTSEKTLKGFNNHSPTLYVGNGQTETTVNQGITSKEKEDLVAKDKSLIKTETTVNQGITSKEKGNFVAKDKSFIKTETTVNQGITSKENGDLIAKDKSFIKTEITVNQGITNKETGDLVAKDKSLIKTETAVNQVVMSKETLKGFNNHNPTWNVGNEQTEENRLSTSTKHFLSDINLFENYFPNNFEVKNREIKRLEIVEIAKKEKFAQKFQITLFSPIGTNLKAQKSKHYASVGILTSISAGVEGAEISGLSNISTGKVEGLQVAGLANISRGETKGVQIAGLVNVNREKVQGLQVAGLANISKNKVKGVQIASVANISNEQVDGAQVAALANVSKKKVRGMQVAAIANATDTLVGAQIGLVNIAKNKARGLQLGLVNIVGENDKVLTIGLINVVKKGGHNLIEISMSEALYGNVSLKTGVRKFYNIFAVGSRLTENSNKKAVLMAYGYGIGTEWDFKKKYNISGELMLYALSPDMKFNKNEKGILAQAKVMLGQKLSKNWGVFGGVTFNMLNSPSGVNIIDKPFTLFNNFKIRDGNVTSWTGLQVGARYFL